MGYGNRQYDRIKEYRRKGSFSDYLSPNEVERDGLSGMMMGENTQKNFKFPRPFFSLSFAPIGTSDVSLEGRTDLIVFQRMPAIVCRNSYKDDYRYVLRGGPRNIKDLVPTRRIYYSYEDFLDAAKHNEYLSFILKCFYVSPVIFEMAKRNLDVEFEIPINYDEYIKLCGGETLFAEYNELADNIVREADKRRKARKKR